MTGVAARAIFEHARRGFAAAIGRQPMPGLRSVRGVVSVLIVSWYDNRVLQTDKFIVYFPIVSAPELQDARYTHRFQTRPRPGSRLARDR